MAWTAPRTWVDGEIVTAAMMNAHVRDNMTVLKTPISNLGRLTGLSSTTVDNLSGVNLTGLVATGAGVNHTAGRQRLTGTSLMRLPVGTDKWFGTKGVDAAGMWVEGTDLHNISSDHTTEWRYPGTLVGSVGVGSAGNFWIEGSFAHYIDASGDERIIDSTATGHSDSNSSLGTLWVETYVHWIRETSVTEQVGHSDVTHGDHNDHADHTDHNDTGPHGDSSVHTDTGSPHNDSPGTHIDHTDVGHADVPAVHSDHTDHTDHDDHTDSGAHGDVTSHSDSTPHTDIAADSRPIVV
jgi:hypothetical protein